MLKEDKQIVNSIANTWHQNNNNNDDDDYNYDCDDDCIKTMASVMNMAFSIIIIFFGGFPIEVWREVFVDKNCFFFVLLLQALTPICWSFLQAMFCI